MRTATITHHTLPGRLATLTALCLLAAANLDACTLWGAAGTHAGGGTIVCKNRDWKPDHQQVLKLRRDGRGYAYFGLCTVYPDKPTEGLAAGVNEKGLSVFTAAASSVPKRLWEDQPVQRTFTGRLLTDYATCEEVLAQQHAIFPALRPAFIMISDRTKILMVEVGIAGKYAIQVTANGVVAHSNHYLDKSLAELNVEAGEGSLVRFDRITQLLTTFPGPFTTTSFAVLSKDQNDGPDNSLWRTGRIARTLASWIVETPADGAPKLMVVIANPGQQEQTQSFVLDEKFWKEKPDGP